VILKKVPHKQRVFLLIVVCTWFSSTYVIAAPLEDISLAVESDNVIATIKLSSPVSNVRYTPAKKGTTLSILLDKVPSGLAVEEWHDNEVLASPPTNLIPSFTVKTNLKNIQPKLIIEFSRQAEYTVQMGRDGRSIVVSITIDAKIPKFNGSLPLLPEVNAVAANATETDKKAAALMLQGRNSLAAGDNLSAIDTFNKLLLLPPNSYTQDGQEWVGVARERAGQLDKAKVELELYLKLYNTPEDISRIKQRLATLGSQPSSPSVITAAGQGKKQFSQTLSYGSISMHYYHGASKTDSVDTSAALGTTASQSSLSNVDQSALLTSVIATERFISEKYDNRIVFQDTGFTNYLPGQTSQNRLGAAYLEIKNKISDYSVRLGRQSSSGGGVLGRFDGAAVGYGITSGIRVNAVAGQLSDYGLLSAPKFYGASVDMGPVTVYAINQNIDDVIERRAVGTEIRYFESNKNAFFTLDYDMLFSAVNVAMLQGTYTSTPERTYNLFIDHRRTPFLSIRNALFGSLTTNLSDLLQFMTEEEIRALAADRTGTSNMIDLGLTQQISNKWQLGGDIRVSRYEDMPESGTPVDPFADPLAPPPVVGFLSSTPSNGNEWAISTQLIGSNLLSSQDVTVFSLSLMGSALYKGQSLYVYSRGNISDKFSLDASVQFYRQYYESGMLMTRVIPSLRTAYQIRKSISLDMDLGLEVSHTEIGTQLTDGQRQFFSLGFRWDF
jgi:hypothetical protein